MQRYVEQLLEMLQEAHSNRPAYRLSKYITFYSKKSGIFALLII
jgi:hypothetical protein